MEKILIERHGTTGLLWLIGWLFTVGYLHLDFVHGLLGLVLWPYYIGSSVAGMLG